MFKCFELEFKRTMSAERFKEAFPEDTRVWFFGL